MTNAQNTNEQIIPQVGLVQIPVKDYQRLLSIEHSYKLLLRGIIENMDLGYGNDDLRANDDELNTVLKLLEPDVYEDRISQLKREREAKRRESEQND